MTHPSAQTLRDYCDFQLGDELRAEIHAHIEHCADCRAFLREEEALVHALTLIETEPAPAALSQQVMDSIRTQPVSAVAGRKRVRVFGLSLLFLGSLLLTIAAGLSQPANTGTSLFTTLRTLLRPLMDQFPRMELPDVLSIDSLLGGHSRTIELAVLVAFILVMLALLDRYILQPLTRQHRGV